MILDDNKTGSQTGLLGAHMALWIIIALLCALFYWASHNTISIVSQAQGEVVPVSRVKQVQHLEGGIVQKILVTEGQLVRKDQELITLKPTQNQADVTALQQKKRVFEIDIIRLEAELSVKTLSVKTLGVKTPSTKAKPIFTKTQQKNSPRLVRQSRLLFLARKQRLTDALAAQDLLVEQRKQELGEVGARLSKNKKALTLLTEQVNISKNLIANKLSNRMQHLDLLKELAQLEGLVFEDVANIALRKASIKAAKAKGKLALSEFIEAARREYDTASRERDDYTEKLAKAKEALSRTTLRAPSDGIIKSIAISGINAVIRSGETVLEIVPNKDKLLIEAKLPTQEIGYIHSGQTAKIQLASADGQRFGTLEGKITHISPDTLVTKDGLPYYKVKILTSKNAFGSKGQSYKLYPGMEVSCSIISGNRTVLSYLIAPFTNLSSKALTER